MKSTLHLLLGLVACCGLVSVGFSEEKKAEKEVTLKGTILCTKCSLGETAACGTAIKVKNDDKEVIYYFKDNGKKEKYHGKVCAKPAEGSVTGTVAEKDGKNWIIPSKDGVKFN